jgi:hypothetical protein
MRLSRLTRCSIDRILRWWEHGKVTVVIAELPLG